MKKILSGSVIATRGDWRVELSWIGEGWSGDYNENDKTDTPLLRFDAMKKGPNGWEIMEDGSYCTQLSATLPKARIKKAANIILNEIYGQDNVKRICESLSWIKDGEV